MTWRERTLLGWARLMGWATLAEGDLLRDAAYRRLWTSISMRSGWCSLSASRNTWRLVTRNRRSSRAKKKPEAEAAEPVAAEPVAAAPVAEAPAFPADPGLAPAAPAAALIVDPGEAETAAIAPVAEADTVAEDGPPKPRKKGWWSLGR